jgi:hypothetical protein
LFYTIGYQLIDIKHLTKLALNKEKISNLNATQLGQIHGGKKDTVVVVTISNASPCYSITLCNNGQCDTVSPTEIICNTERCI